MKGSVFDILTGFIWLFVIAVVLILVSYFSNTAASLDIFANNTAANTSMAYANNGVHVFDSVMILFVLAIALGSIISASMIESRPIFFIIFMMLNAGVYMLNAVFSNAFISFASDPALAATANQYSFTVILMQNAPLISMVLGFIVALFFYAKGGSINP